MEIFGIGLGEMLLIAVVALMIVGPERLPEAARSMGRFIGDIRRATEPARSAIRDISEEINRATSAATVNQKPSGNPWEVHPIMQGMTQEERETFLAGGEMPERIAKELESQTLHHISANGSSPEEIGDLDYPMPHSELKYESPGGPSVEKLDYPPPS
jgi:sec-independent protein translocase protein TatB